MALFGSKKKTAAPAADKTAKTEAKKTFQGSQDLAHVIRRPRITEKASMKAEQGAYAFEVARDATKAMISKAVQDLYNVTPIKVTVMRIPTKRIIVRGKPGIKRGGKKAYVYLKKGQTIEFV